MSRHQVPEGWTIQAYRFALDPTPTQARAMASNVGAARFVYNWGPGLVESRLHERRRLGEANAGRMAGEHAMSEAAHPKGHEHAPGEHESEHPRNVRPFRRRLTA